MSEDKMTVERVLALIAAFGGDPEDWPETDREPARALLLAQPDAFAVALADAKELDRFLARQPIPEPSAGLAERILSTAPKPVARPSARLMGWLFPRGLRWPAGAVVSSLVIGIVSGYAYAGSLVGDTAISADDAYESAFGYTVLNDWAEMEVSE